jgi:hypothetical protein
MISGFCHGVNEILDCLTLEDGTDRLSQDVGNKLPIYVALTFQNSEGRILELNVLWYYGRYKPSC